MLVFGGQPQLFYLDRDYLLGDHTEVLTKEDRSTPHSLLVALRREKVTHVLTPEVMVFPPGSPAGSIEGALQGLVGAGVLRPVADYYGPMILWVVASER